MNRVLLIVGVLGASMLQAREPVDYARDVQPIFAEHCFRCHGADRAESGLRLDLRESALKAADSGDLAIVPGDPKSSGVLDRVQSDDPDLRMPPDSEPLDQDQRAVLRRWISAGAKWSLHWSFRTLSTPVLPSVANQSWPETPLDRFVLARLEQEQINPSREAMREKLIRRLSYDLLGVPPTVDAVHRFVHDASPLAYEHVVDAMLASPMFGERWGRHWLDKARYADSDGYEKDNHRPHAWRYRDWVIDAINSDLPFDEFTVWQLAGDLLPAATDDQILATAFHRQTLTNTEGGTDKEQWRVAAVMDRTETVGTVWLGLTIGCARCHNHKYDQISQAEYYQLYAYFNNADEGIHRLPPTRQQLDAYGKQRRDHQQKLMSKHKEIAALERSTAACWSRPTVVGFA